MLDALNQTWVGSVLGLVGIVLGLLGLIAYRRSRIGPRPVFQVHSRRLIGKQEQELPTEVEILFNHQPVPRVTISRVVFWNSGNATLLGSNVVPEDALRLEFADGVILKARLVKTSRDVLKLALEQDTGSPRISVSFDFLDPGDGAVVEIVHTSPSRNPAFLGTIRGVPGGITSLGSDRLPFPYVRWPLPTMGLWMVAVSGLGMVVYTIVAGKTLWQQVAFSAFGLLYLGSSIYFLWIRRRRYPKTLQVDE